MTDAVDPPGVDRKVLLGATRQDLIKLASDIHKLRQQAARAGPQTDDELHEFIKSKWGIHVARVAVDPGHKAPFDVIADVFFERVRSVIVVGGRDSGKTFNVQIIHAANARFKPGYEGITAGAVDEQSRNAINALKWLNNKWGGDGTSTKEESAVGDVKSSLKRETNYGNGSKVSIIGGTRNQLNGPHVPVLCRDEIELFKRDAFEEGNNITSSGETTDGRTIKAIDILASSMKFAKGILQELLDEVKEAKESGREPPHEVYVFGVAETIQNQAHHCRHDPANKDKPESELCPCNRYFKGKWDDGSDRTLDAVCAGRFAKSDGHRLLDPDIIGKFTANSRGMWESQQECLRPAAEGLILAEFTQKRYGVRGWLPDPENGKVYLGVDFGGTNAQAALWAQYLDRAVEATNYHGETIVIPRDSYVVFDEVYLTEIGNNSFARVIKTHESDWRQQFTFFEVTERYADVASKSARIDFRQTHNLPTVWRITREVEVQIDKVVETLEDSHLYVDVERCPMWCAEAEAWQRDPDTGKQIDTFNHLMSGTRYLIANVDRKLIVERKHPLNRDEVNEATAQPTAQEHEHNQDAGDVLAKVPATGPAGADWQDDDPTDFLPMHGSSSPHTGRMF